MLYYIYIIIIIYYHYHYLKCYKLMEIKKSGPLYIYQVDIAHEALNS